MSEWKEYIGSKEQIAEMKNSTNGYMVRNLNPNDVFVLSSRVRYAFELWGDSIVSFEYLICNPHPLADMICQQARTGQPVWIRVPVSNNDCSDGYLHYRFIKVESGLWYYVTTTPDWNVPNAEYSFAPFDEPHGKEE